MSKQATVDAAVVGTTFQDQHDEVHIVTDSCGSNGGQWYCITHLEPFANQLQKDTHISRGTHVLGWVCLEHGVETP